MRKNWVLFIIVFLASGGCGEKAQEGPSPQKLPPIPRVEKALPQTTPTPSPIAVPSEKRGQTDQPYNPIGKPDPFQPTRVALEGKEGGKVLPLERFEVNEFELVGVVTGSGIRKAMIQDMTGKGFLIQVGTRIGKRGGKVIQIRDKEVVIEEPYLDFLERKSFRKIILKISQPQ